MRFHASITSATHTSLPVESSITFAIRLGPSGAYFIIDRSAKLKLPEHAISAPFQLYKPPSTMEWCDFLLIRKPDNNKRTSILSKATNRDQTSPSYPCTLPLHHRINSSVSSFETCRPEESLRSSTITNIKTASHVAITHPSHITYRNISYI